MRWIVRLLGIMVSLVVLAVGALFLIPAERLAGLVAQQFEAATGRALTISGPVRPTVWPVIGARVEDVTLASADWATAGPLLRAQVLDMGLDLRALIGGSLTVRRFELIGAELVLERHQDGRANWVFTALAEGPAVPATPAPPSARAEAERALSLERVEIRDAALRYIDRSTDTDLRIEGVDADLSMPALDGPGRVAVTGRMGGEVLTAEVQLASVARTLSGQVAGVELTARLGEARIGFQGRAGLGPLAADGRLTARVPALAPFLVLAGRPGPEPLPPAALPLDFAGQVTLAPAGSLHLREARLGLGAQRLDLALDLTLDGARPRLSGQVSAGALDLRPFMGTAAPAAPAPTPAAHGWPTTAIDASALGRIDAELALTAGPVQAGVIDLDRLSAVLAIDRVRAVLTLREVRALGGTASGELVANNRSGLSVGGNLRLAEIGLLPLLRQAAGFERLTGTAGGEVRFLGVGQSADAIMRSLSGEGRLNLGQGEIIGLDLAGMLRNMDMSYMGEQNRTVYDGIAGSFAIDGGVLRNEDLRLTSALLTVEGRGRVDLGAQTLDYRATPVALRDAATGREIRVPLVISGPWSAPRFRLDLEGLAEERLREERERLESRAREEAERLQARARDEAARLEAEARARAEQEVQRRLGLGPTPVEGEPVRDTVERGLRDRAEQELGRGLRRLLGGD